MDSRTSSGIRPVVLALGLSVMAAFAAVSITVEEAAAQKEEVKAVETGWEAEAEDVFGLKQGLGKKLLLKDEWEEHRERMEKMTVEDKDAHVKDIHKSLMRRARLQGIAIPKD